MRLHRFFVDEYIDRPLGELPDGEVWVSSKGLIHQWKDVFRLRAGDDVILLDNTGLEYLSNISELHKEGARLHITEVRRVKNIPARNVTLACSVIKKDHFEWVLEKGTELGVSRFIAVISERSEKKDLNMERARKILREASEQSGRGAIPLIEKPRSLEEVLGEISRNSIVFDPSGEQAEHGALTVNPIAMCIGPEGGWTEREIQVFGQKGIKLASLGPQILRAETAAIAAATLALL